jgi:hypothetical protein
MKNNCGGVVMKGGLGALIIYGKCWCLLGREVSGVAINKKLTRNAEVVLINVVNSIILTRNLNVSNSFLDKNSHNFLLDYGI